MSFANPVIVAIAVALFAATVLSALISSARTFVARVRDPEWLAAIAFAPVLAGAVSMLLLLGQHPWGSCHCLVHGSEHPHVCLAHPLLAAPLLPFAWVVIGLVIGNAGRGLARGA